MPIQAKRQKHNKTKRGSKILHEKYAKVNFYVENKGTLYLQQWLAVSFAIHIIIMYMWKRHGFADSSW